MQCIAYTTVTGSQPVCVSEIQCEKKKDSNMCLRSNIYHGKPVTTAHWITASMCCVYGQYELHFFSKLAQFSSGWYVALTAKALVARKTTLPVPNDKPDAIVSAPKHLLVHRWQTIDCCIQWLLSSMLVWFVSTLVEYSLFCAQARRQFFRKMAKCNISRLRLSITSLSKSNQIYSLQNVQQSAKH